MNSYIDEYKDLRQLITENPSLPLIFMASDDCGSPDWAWVIASARAKKGILLDAKGPNEEKIYSSEDDLRKDLEQHISDLNTDWNYEKVEAVAEEEIKACEDKWIDVIYIYIESY